METRSSAYTVVMATFNGADYLADQLASLEAQAMPPCRLIVSDDGSTDTTRQIVASFAKEANFDVVVLDGPQLGYAENFWSAAKLVDTKYVAWADQDDVWHPQKILRCVETLEETGAFFASHSATVVDNELRPLGRSNPDYERTRVLGPLEGNAFDFPCGFATVFRRDILDQIDWNSRPKSHQTERLVGHDEAVALIAFALHSRVQLNEPLAYYRQHDSNSIGDQSVTGRGRVSAVLKYSADLKFSAESYARRASRAEGYARYISLIAENSSPAVDLFRAAAERARLREELRNGKTFHVRLRFLLESIRKGNYRAEDNGGFGFQAFANDSLALCLSIAPVRPLHFKSARSDSIPAHTA